MRAEDVMATPLASAEPILAVHEIADLMAIGGVPVLDRTGKLIGIMSRATWSRR